MADLITLDRALQQIPQARAADYPAILSIIAACSAAAERFCQRTFAQATFDELHSFQTQTPYLFVRNPPISKINWVRATQLPACYVQYADPDNQTQQATVEVTATGVTLTKIYGGATATSTLTFADHPTFADLGAAINAVSGWTATVSQQFAKWQTADMIPQGGYSARNVAAALLVYWSYLSNFRVERGALGEVYNPSGFAPGAQAYRVSYVGGYDPIPDDLQQAVAELVQLTWASTRLNNPLMTTETIDKYSYTRAAEASIDQLSLTSKLTLKAYRVMRVARWRA